MTSFSYSVSPRINIKGGGVHQSVVHEVWLTMFNQSYKTVFFSINFKFKGWGSALWGKYCHNFSYSLS